MKSPPHGGVDRNWQMRRGETPFKGRPLTGAWIETVKALRANHLGKSRPLTGAWIETFREVKRFGG